MSPSLRVLPEYQQNKPQVSQDHDSGKQGRDVLLVWSTLSTVDWLLALNACDAADSGERCLSLKFLRFYCAISSEKPWSPGKDRKEIVPCHSELCLPNALLLRLPIVPRHLKGGTVLGDVRLSKTQCPVATACW